MKNLLLIGNIDGDSKSLLRYASRMCKDLNLRLHILQIEKNNNPLILSSPYYFNKFGFNPNQERIAKKKKLEHFVRSNTNDILDTEWLSFKLMGGDISHCVDTFINSEKIDLLIIRQSVLLNLKIEQNKVFSEIFTNISDLPMLVIPDNQVYKSLNQFTFFITFTEDDFRHIEWVSKNFKSPKIDLIHFSGENNTKGEKWVDYLLSEVQSIEITYESISTSLKGFINEKINIANSTYNCAVLTTQKRNFWQRIIDPSTTLSIVPKIEVPVLIFKKQKQ